MIVFLNAEAAGEPGMPDVLYHIHYLGLAARSSRKVAPMNMSYQHVLLALSLTLPQPLIARADEPNLVDHAAPLPGTSPLTLQGDLADLLVSGVDRFLLHELDLSVKRRARHWKRDFSSPEAYTKSLEPNRQRLAHLLGVHYREPWFGEGLEILGQVKRPRRIGRGNGYTVFAVRWTAEKGIHGEGLFLVPDREQVADVVAIPDADQTPEQLIGLLQGVKPESQYARRLAESRCRVLVPTLIDRKLQHRHAPGTSGGALLSDREFLYRPVFELGRHLIGYEVEKVLAGVEYFLRDGSGKIGIIGWGEGGMLALYAGALNPRVNAVCVSGYFDERKNLWEEPIDRNVFGLLGEFGDAELASMIPPRQLLLEAGKGPELILPGQGGAPARLITPAVDSFKRECERARKLVSRLHLDEGSTADACISSVIPAGTFADEATLKDFLRKLAEAPLAPSGARPEPNPAAQVNISERQLRQQEEIDRHTQHHLVESPYVRAKFMSKLDTSSLEKYQRSVEPYREFFAKEVIGQFDYKPLPANPRTRKAYDKPNWTGYEVVLDVFPDVIAYGILLLPKDLKPGEKRPVVVCQHGLEGRPQDVVTGNNPAYHDFAARLAERGFITFAPQNLYIFHDRFRSLQRKANPLGKTLFSIIVPQHQQIVNWLKTLPNVDPKRIAFYGLSYGGKSAMRIPPLVPDYCLSICSADFNEWVWKNASTRSPYSYVWSGEYEIFEFDLGSTFNYAEMAALIAPRPFMVERGHFDGVAPDETVAHEFAKVRFLYEAKLGIGDRCEIEWFVGPHTINGKGTFAFLEKHLSWHPK
jgi:dienelactone hydrolase